MITTPTQLPDGWVKPSASGNGSDCFRFKPTENGMIMVASTRLPDATPIEYSKSELAALIKSVKAGEFDYLTA